MGDPAPGLQGATPRFAFLVHPLTSALRRIQGVRTFRPRLALGLRDGTSPFDIARLCRIGIPGAALGAAWSVPLTPDQMLADQERALSRMLRAGRMAGDVQAIGLGSLCAVVAGRGEALAERLPVPVTTGAAATAWALVENTRAVLGAVGGPVGVVGASGAVGFAVAALLAGDGHDVRVDHRRAKRAGSVTVCDGPAEAVAGCAVVVGAGPTGATLDAGALRPGAVVVDVAIPGTLVGRPPPGVVVLAGEAVATPPTWWRDGWGALYQALAGYGPTQIFACVAEPLVLAATGRGAPWALGRSVSPETVVEFGAAARALGFRPRLARGWFEVSVGRIAAGRAPPALPPPPPSG